MNRILQHGLVAGILMSGVLFGPFFVIGPDPDWAQRWGRLIGYTGMVLALTATFFDALPQQLYDSYLAAARASEGDPTTVAARVAEVEAMRGFFFNYPMQGAVMGATVFLIGAVESLVGAAIVRRRV